MILIARKEDSITTTKTVEEFKQFLTSYKDVNSHFEHFGEVNVNQTYCFDNLVDGSVAIVEAHKVYFYAQMMVI